MYKALGITPSGTLYSVTAHTHFDAFLKIIKVCSDYDQIIITRITAADIRQGRE